MKNCRFKLFMECDKGIALLAVSENGEMLWNLCKHLRNYRVVLIDSKTNFKFYKDHEPKYDPRGDVTAPVYFTEVHIAKKTGRLHFYTDNSVEHYEGDRFELHIDGVIDASVVLQQKYMLDEEEKEQLFIEYTHVYPECFKLLCRKYATHAARVYAWEKATHIYVYKPGEDELL